MTQPGSLRNVPGGTAIPSGSCSVKELGGPSKDPLQWILSREGCSMQSNELFVQVRVPQRVIACVIVLVLVLVGHVAL